MLPDDILFMICEQLRRDTDFNTLFQCSMTSKSLAAAALPSLWRIHDIAPCSSNGPEGEVNNVPKWMTLWRTLILATYTGSTYMDYLNYIRVLSLRDLGHLFEESEFRKTGKKKFFAGRLQEFNGPFKKLENQAKHNYTEWNTASAAVSAMIGDRITGHIANLSKINGRKSIIEELDCGLLPSEALQQFISGISALKSLRVWNGSALVSSGTLLRDHCPGFNSLTIYSWNEPNTDDDFSDFLCALQAQSLKVLRVEGSSTAKALVAKAMAEHNNSLTDVKFSAAHEWLFRALPTIGACKNLKTFVMDMMFGSESNSESKQELGNWFASCTSLTDVILNLGIDVGPEILTPLLLSPARLVRLSLRSFTGGSAVVLGFYRALAAQADSLEILTLHGEPEEPRDENLINSLVQLRKMRELQLIHVSNNFATNDIIKVVEALTNLEDLSIAGWNISDAIWPAMSKLHALRTLDLNAYSTFTLTGILGYVENLSEGNKGLFLAISMADPFSPLYETEQIQIRGAIEAKVGGRFEYMMARDPNAESDDESDSD